VGSATRATAAKADALVALTVGLVSLSVEEDCPAFVSGFWKGFGDAMLSGLLRIAQL